VRTPPFYRARPPPLSLARPHGARGAPPQRAHAGVAREVEARLEALAECMVVVIMGDAAAGAALLVPRLPEPGGVTRARGRVAELGTASIAGARPQPAVP
jgi:hypothetical protein